MYSVRIVINAIPLLSPLTGVGSYIYNIAKRLKSLDNSYEYIYFYGYFSKGLLVYTGEKRILRDFNKIKYYAKKIPFVARSLRTLKGYLSKIPYKEFDLYFEPNFIPLDGISAKRVVTTIPDFSFYKYPQWHPRDRIEFFKENFWKNICRSHIIITGSHYIKTEVLKLLNFNSDKIKVIYYGYDKDVLRTYNLSDLSTFRVRFKLPKYFLLFVGALEPRKNLECLIKAYMSLNKDMKKDLKLVLAGASGWRNEGIMSLIKKEKENIHYLGYVSNQELAFLYNLATLFVYPSLYEGFGLPPLEAMACGCPAVVSNVSALPEVCGDAAYYVDPHHVESVAEGIYKLLDDEDLRKKLIKRGLERAKTFSWEKSAMEHLKVFEETTKQ